MDRPASGLVAVQIATTIQHACARMADATVRCWGDGTSGEVDGVVGSGEHHTPVEVPGVRGAIDVVVGGSLSCARLATGEVWCWGSHSFVAMAEDDHGTAPAPVQELAGATRLWLAQDGDGCAKWADGAIQCWGGAAGYLAVGAPGRYGSGPAPVVPELRGATEIALHDTLGCAVMPDTTVRCWGVNNDGQLGDGTQTRRLTPVPVRDLTGVAQITVGDRSACARLRDGTVSCWGGNDMGQLGALPDGDGDHQLTPVAVPGLWGVVELSTATVHSCARLASGKVMCWGVSGPGNDARAPAEVAGLTRVTQLGTAHAHDCALRAEGGVMCWGSGDRGVLGDGMQIDHARPVAVKWALPPVESHGLAAGRSVVEVAVGDQHSCARLDDSSVRCWGRNDDGRVDTAGRRPAVIRPVVVPGLGVASALALGTHSSALVERRAMRWGNPPGPPAGFGDEIEQLVTAGYTCALRAGGALHCLDGFGKELWGEHIAAVSAYGPFVCAIALDRTVRCAGYNDAYQLGVDQPAERATFEPVPGVAGAAEIVTGFEHACARIADGHVICWGRPQATGGKADAPGQVEPVGLGAVEAIWAGGESTCARKPGGAVWCWGAYRMGAPDGDTGSAVPRQVPGLTGARSIALGSGHACALLANGEVGCWGDNNYGQLGDGTMDARPEASRVQW
ncbi:MAG TPA: hypothetical protein VGC42_07185 [Kofleriaceae bacterium]